MLHIEIVVEAYSLNAVKYCGYSVFTTARLDLANIGTLQLPLEALTLPRICCLSMLPVATEKARPPRSF